jgi:hypothetical protein
MFPGPAPTQRPSLDWSPDAPTARGPARRRNARLSPRRTARAGDHASRPARSPSSRGRAEKKQHPITLLRYPTSNLHAPFRPHAGSAIGVDTTQHSMHESCVAPDLTLPLEGRRGPAGPAGFNARNTIGRAACRRSTSQMAASTSTSVPRRRPRDDRRPRRLRRSRYEPPRTSIGRAQPPESGTAPEAARGLGHRPPATTSTTRTGRRIGRHRTNARLQR